MRTVSSFLAGLVALCLVSCVSKKASEPVTWTQPEEIPLALRVIGEDELTRRFGQGAENNPYIPMQGLFLGGYRFALIEIKNTAASDVAIKDSIICNAEDGGDLRVFSANDLGKYWATVKMYEDFREAKKEVVRKSYLSYASPLRPGESRVILVGIKGEPPSILRISVAYSLIEHGECRASVELQNLDTQ